MAVKLNETSKGILGKNAEKIGNYTEATGGGTPLEKGEKLKDHPEAKRVMQPRDEDGKFTYNSANGKELKYGPSRGTTVPPFLRGIKLTYCAPGTKLKIEGEDGIKIKLMTVDMSVEQMVHNCKQYIESEGGFAGMGEGSSITKKGKKSKEEKEAEAGQIGYKDPKELSEKTQKEMAEAKEKYEKNNSNTEINPKVGSFQVNTDKLNPDGSVTKMGPTYSQFTKDNQEKKAMKFATKNEEMPNNKIDDDYIYMDEEEETPVKPSGEPVKKETEAEKQAKKEELLKAMGLNGDDIDFDVEEINKDPKAFVNSPQFKSIWKTIPKGAEAKPGVPLKAGHIVQNIKNGKFKNPAQLKNWIKKKYGNK